MKFTVEENREAIKRYAHIRPASRRGVARCSARCPGTERSCTLERDHRGPHVAHGRFKKVLAVWDAGADVQRAANQAKAPVRVSPRVKPWDGGPGGALTALVRGIVRRAPPLEDILLLVFFLGMVGFVLDWALRIIGWK